MIIVRIHRDRELQVRTGLQNNDAILVPVEDSGSRFDPKRLGNSMMRFSRQSHGIGLGLAICRMIVERHGGLTAASDGNTGARFQFVLPTKFSDAAPAN